MKTNRAKVVRLTKYPVSLSFTRYLRQIREQELSLAKKRAQAVRDRITVLKREYGTYENIGKIVDINRGYLHQLHTGKKTNPSLKILSKLGLMP